MQELILVDGGVVDAAEVEVGGEENYDMDDNVVNLESENLLYWAGQGGSLGLFLD